MTSRRLLTIARQAYHHVKYLSTVSPQPIVFSGIQPTGIPHLGNYLGAIQHWKRLQAMHEQVIYCIVDWHAMTVTPDAARLRRNVREMAACLLACGLDPERSIVFQQSSVKEHVELAWVLACLTTLPQLAHQPQWRDKSARQPNPSLALFTYPVLQSADILLYRTTSVPVGEDQIKHIELTRHLARTFNNRYGQFFPEPEAVLTQTKRIRSLRNPLDKMSKSDVNEKSRIDIVDDDQVIRFRLQKAKTDTLGRLTFDPEQRPGVANLIEIHSGLTGASPEQICRDCQDMNMSAYKEHLSEVVIASLRPIREEYQRLCSDQSYIQNVLKNGAERAREIASSNLLAVKKMIGIS